MWTRMLIISVYILFYIVIFHIEIVPFKYRYRFAKFTDKSFSGRWTESKRCSLYRLDYMIKSRRFCNHHQSGHPGVISRTHINGHAKWKFRTLSTKNWDPLYLVWNCSDLKTAITSLLLAGMCETVLSSS